MNRIEYGEYIKKSIWIGSLCILSAMISHTLSVYMGRGDPIVWAYLIGDDRDCYIGMLIGVCIYPLIGPCIHALKTLIRKVSPK